MNLAELRHAIEAELQRGTDEKEIQLAVKAVLHDLSSLDSAEWHQRIAELAASHYLTKNPKSD